MGIDYTAVRALAYAKASGVNFDKTLTLGHQELHVRPHDVRQVFGEFSIPFSPTDSDRVFQSKYADELFRQLGAHQVDSIDAAEYEGASIIHDMNTPTRGRGLGGYTLVFDGGTLEHVFNFPVASRNVIELAAVGGHIVSVVPANNLCGHGFYQFSPELFFRVFGKRNGCEVISIFMADTAPHRPWQRVTDPHLLGRRVNLHHFYATNMVMLALKLTDHLDSGFVPQQSDYELGVWKESSTARANSRLREAKSMFLERLPVSVWSRLKALRDFLTHTGYRGGHTEIKLRDMILRDRNRRP